jgi:hypothetical protein
MDPEAQPTQFDQIPVNSNAREQFFEQCPGLFCGSSLNTIDNFLNPKISSVPDDGNPPVTKFIPQKTPRSGFIPRPRVTVPVESVQLDPAHVQSDPAPPAPDQSAPPPPAPDQSAPPPSAPAQSASAPSSDPPPKRGRPKKSAKKGWTHQKKRCAPRMGGYPDELDVSADNVNPVTSYIERQHSEDGMSDYGVNVEPPSKRTRSHYVNVNPVILSRQHSEAGMDNNRVDVISLPSTVTQSNIDDGDNSVILSRQHSEAGVDNNRVVVESLPKSPIKWQKKLPKTILPDPISCSGVPTLLVYPKTGEYSVLSRDCWLRAVNNYFGYFVTSNKVLRQIGTDMHGQLGPDSEVVFDRYGNYNSNAMERFFQGTNYEQRRLMKKNDRFVALDAVMDIVSKNPRLVLLMRTHEEIKTQRANYHAVCVINGYVLDDMHPRPEKRVVRFEEYEYREKVIVGYHYVKVR